MAALEELDSRDGIFEAAMNLARHLKFKYEDNRGTTWTEHNFEILRSFCKERWGLNPETDCFHKRREGHPEDLKEFLWDFIAVTKERGILLAVESEQASHTKGLKRDLNHDFEKLLYVFAPIKLLIVKGKKADEQRIIDELVKYAGGCCQHFNPGSIFLIHFGAWKQDEGITESRTYCWQAEGKPMALKRDDLNFTLLSS